MKLFLILFLFPIFVFSQDNFQAVDGNVVWQRVYKDSVSSQQYIKHLNTTLSQEVPCKLVADYTSGQTTYMDILEDKSSLSAFYKKAVKFSYVVDFQEGKYRVTVKNIAFEGIEVSIYGVNDSSDTYLDASLIRSRDGELRKNNMAQHILQRLDTSFTDLFAYKDQAGW